MVDGNPLEAAETVVKMRGIVKQFPGVVANDHVDFTLYRGEIHALLGENGAGKSTLMNVLAGIYRQEHGHVYIHDREVHFSSPRDAIMAGIGMVHQHFMLVPSLTVTENILLGLDEPRFVMNLDRYDQAIAALSEQYGLRVDPKAKVWQLSVGEQQRVELLKMLYRGAEILILDEPTAVLAPVEIDELFLTLRSMVANGKSIIFISHKLNEVLAISDRLTVLRRGQVTADGIPLQGITRRDLARLMVGREVIFEFEKQAHATGDDVLCVENIWSKNDKGLDALKGVSFSIKAGEIVGIAAVAGNGQSELAEVVTGLRRSSKGTVRILGEDFTNSPVRRGIQFGVGHIPEDRTHVGTAPNLDVTDNVIMKNYAREPIGHGMVVDMGAAHSFAKDLRALYDIVVPNIDTPVRLLSGGNLQRLILARELSGNPPFLVAVQPTRGLDVGAIEGVQRLLLKQREEGAAILLISEELDELLRLSDRLFVFYEGEIMGEITNVHTNDDELVEQIGLMMTGTRMDELHLETEGASHHD
ncbi:MAG: ABC transporter ATP-binding protein [Anaerolineae bacterium]|nr:ABC transporter ATP-binding protein [Anaerolineae bacterium]